MQGSEGYKGARKGTTFAAQAVGLAAATKARELGFQKVRVKLKGPGQGRQVSGEIGGCTWTLYHPNLSCLTVFSKGV